MTRSWAFSILFLLGLCRTTNAEVVSYALAIGNNEPPAGEEYQSLAKLRYADDDAVRFSQFFEHFAKETYLLTVLDEETQKRYPNLAPSTRPPTLENLMAITTTLVDKMKEDRAIGKQPVLYLAFSGHGEIRKDGSAFLSFLDKELTSPQLYEQVLTPLPAEYIHLFIDACHAGAMVSSRGFFNEAREYNSQKVPLTKQEALKLAGFTADPRLPGLGFVVSSTADQETHEWERIESGVFTHELLSGLYGPADVNHDGNIEYSEIHAFVAAANRDIPDPRAVPQLVVQPPVRNLRAPLVELSSFSQVVALQGNPSQLGHFFIELENGQRFLDANLDTLTATIAIPNTMSFYLRTSTQEAAIDKNQPATIPIASLIFQKRSTTSRGSVDSSLRNALFTSPFGVTYYKGFVDRTNSIGVDFEDQNFQLTRSLEESDPWKRPLSITLLTAAAASAVTAIILGSLAIQAKVDYDQAQFMRESDEARERLQTYSTAAIITGGAAIASGIVAWLLWPETPPERRTINLSAWAGESNGVSFSLRW